MSDTMTPEQAIGILDNLAAQVQLTRRDHEIAIEAVKLLTQVVADAGDQKKGVS